MSKLPFGRLPAFAPRRFVPPDLDLGVWSQVEPLFDRLETRAAQCASVADLERWLFDWSEVTAALDEEAARRHIAMTCHTDDAGARAAYLEFVEEIEPRLKPRQFGLSRLFLAHPLRASLPRARYEVFDRDTEVQVQLFRSENVPLETEETRLGQQYQELTGSLTVHFQGEERTLPQMARVLEETDRGLRQEAWELVARRRRQEAEKFDAFFDALVRLREQIAVNAGFPNYLEYAFRALHRFDYMPSNCLEFHAAVESEIMPALREIQATRRGQLQVSELRPWDLEVDPLHRPPLRPFADVGQLLSRMQQVFEQLDPVLASGFRQMQEAGLLDLDNRKGKAPGGYQQDLGEARLPFIFMNAVGLQGDVECLLHEAGHAFHALAARGEDLFWYRHAPIEFCEVASMSMELLGHDHLQSFYTRADADRARRRHLEGILKVFPWIATVDAFQHRIYTHAGHGRAERRAAWLAQMDRFGSVVDWSGYESERANLWHRQLHIFLHPLYYVEYGIAQLGALQVWANARRNRMEALRAWHRALSLGGSRPLPELFEAAGCRFEFGAQAIRPLVELIRTELKKLG